ncbi:MAG: hypothetical protein AAF809_11260 [Bacteroidota bacterium]
MATLLEEDGRDHWATWMATSAKHLRRAEYGGLVHLQRAYGGMGSFNDLWVEIQGDPPNARVERLRQLRESVWMLAEEIRREAEFE